MPRRTKQAPAVPFTKPSLGFALIAKDAEHTIGRCLSSIRPIAQQIVVCVDERTTDKTAAIARRHGAEIHKVRVSDWHECAQHDRVLAQHFANARDESFRHLDPSLEWWAWIDADDVFVGADKLPGILDSIPPEVIGLWMPYHYSTMQGGAVTNTLFHRERILRANVGWRWEFRVHEVVTPLRQGPWLMANDVAMYHQEGAHKTESSALRNLLLLEIDLESDPRSSRTLFYLGNQYFAMGKWDEAIYWYEALGQLANNRSANVNTYELWQARCYQAMAAQKSGDLQTAQQAAFAALDARPEHPEPYFILASIYALAGEPDKTVYWTEHGRKQKEPPFFVFKNPLDYNFNNRLPMSDALAQMGRISEAKAELEAAHQTYADPHVAEGIEHYRKIEEEAERGRLFRDWAKYMLDQESDVGPQMVTEQYNRLPIQVRGIQSVRDVAVPLLHYRNGKSQGRIVFWAAAGWEEWGPPKLNTTGIGGSETAVIEIAKRFAADGWQVDVYNNAGAYEGVYDGVGYWDARRYQPDPTPDIMVNWRMPFAPTPAAQHTIIWCHDLNYGPNVDLSRFEKVMGVSAWHAGMLKKYYGLSDELVGYVPNGINLDRFDPGVKKVPFRCVYASSADRGLLQLLHLWPQIVATEKTAELHVAYGWDTIDRMISQGRTDLSVFKDAVNKKVEETPNVVWRGRLPQDELAKLYSESWLWLYPTNFLEVSCISAMEAMAGGAVPVTSAAGALKETIGNAGVVVAGLPHSFPWQDFYVQCARATLIDASVRKPLEHMGRKRAAELTWDIAYQAHWLPIVNGLMAPEREIVLA